MIVPKSLTLKLARRTRLLALKPKPNSISLIEKSLLDMEFKKKMTILISPFFE